MKSWKTTVVALIGAICVVLGNQFPELKDVFTNGAAFSIALLGFFAKDKSTTGIQ